MVEAAGSVVVSVADGVVVAVAAARGGWDEEEPFARMSATGAAVASAANVTSGQIRRRDRRCPGDGGVPVGAGCKEGETACGTGVGSIVAPQWPQNRSRSSTALPHNPQSLTSGPTGASLSLCSAQRDVRTRRCAHQQLIAGCQAHSERTFRQC